eukprot:scaffold3946_cov118-Isochrysis_galbana.AAC.3
MTSNLAHILGRHVRCTTPAAAAAMAPRRAKGRPLGMTVNSPTQAQASLREATEPQTRPHGASLPTMPHVR